MHKSLSRLMEPYSSLRPGHRVLILLLALVAILLVASQNNDVSTTMSSIQAAIISVSAAGGLIVAIEGLDTWHREIRGRSDYDLAMNLGKDVVHMRDLLCTAGVMRIESPAAMSGGPTGRLEGEKEPVSLVASWKSPGYIREIESAIERLWEHRKEAEVLWGEEVHDVVFPLESLAFELTNYAGYLRFRDDPNTQHIKAPWDELYGNKRNPIPELDGKQENHFQADVKAAARKARGFLSQFLDRKLS